MENVTRKLLELDKKLDERMPADDDARYRNKADSPNQLLFINIPYDNDDDDDDDSNRINTFFRNFLRTRLHFKEDQIELLHIKKLYYTPYGNPQNGTRPMLVKFVNAFEKDWVHERAQTYLDREEFLSAGGREITGRQSNSSRNDPVAEEPCEEGILCDGITLLIGDPQESSDGMFAGYLTEIRSPNSVKDACEAVKQRYGDPGIIQHMPYAFRIREQAHFGQIKVTFQ